MVDVVNRTTKSLLRSVNTPEYPSQDWIHNPDLSAVEGWPNKYWVIIGDTITLMTQAQRDQVDADELQARRDGTAAQLDQLEDVLRAFALAVLDEFNGHADKINAILDAADNAISLADFKTRMAAISDYPQRTIGQMKTSVRNKLGS